MGLLSRAATALTLALVASTAAAIETDQYYAWGRELADAAEPLNAKVNLEIEGLLAELNDRRPNDLVLTCGVVRKRIVRHFRLFLVHRVELWALNTSLVERIPATADEELEWRKRHYVYHDRAPLDPARLVPPSPTIDIDGIRLGTDKLTHFFSEGWLYYRWYEGGLEDGLDEDEALARAIDRGIFTERTILGQVTSGAFSMADLESNYQGMRWYIAMCERPDPLLTRGPDGWRLKTFDFRDWVGPGWDESWAPSIVGKRRYRRVRPVLESYCPMLDDPWVIDQRTRYGARDRETATARRVRELVEKGKLRDPAEFSIESVCREAAAR